MSAKRRQNRRIYEAIKKAGFCHWEVAENILGIRSDTFSRKLRHELPMAEQERILNLIKKAVEAEQKQ